jgi:sulfatase maturation enzyme AslB (radical SAM superfamily)
LNSVQTIELSQLSTHADKLTWFRFGHLGNKVLLTTDTGEWHALEPEAFSSLISGALPEDGPHYADLVRKGFIRNGFDVELHAGQLRRSKRYLDSGASLHRIHLSTASETLPMDQAKAVLDHIFTSQAATLTIALIQGPKALDPDTVSFIQEFAEQKNKYEKRDLFYELHCPLDGLDDAMIDSLIERRIQVRTCFDGDASVHDAQRALSGAPAHSDIAQCIEAIHAAATKAELEPSQYSTFAEVHVSAKAVGHASGIVRGLAAAGVRDFGLTPVLEGEGALSPGAYGEFVQELLRILAQQEDGTNHLREVNADALMARIRSGDVVDNILMCSPPSTGYNARSYGPDGNIFPSCSALQLHQEGDPVFLLGNVANASVEDISNHSTIRSLMVASLIDCLPGYRHLWSAPYIGVDPVAAYRSTGDIFTKMLTSPIHRATQAMVEAIFLHLMDAEGDGEE